LPCMFIIVSSAFCRGGAATKPSPLYHAFSVV
jgi:hypothetical protein